RPDPVHFRNPRCRRHGGQMSEPEYRAQFDATVTFSNGGELSARDFRVDVPHAEVSTAEVGALFVASLSLLMVDRVEVTRLRVFPEQHKGTRGGPAYRTAAPAGRRVWVELSHPIEAGMVTYPGLAGLRLDVLADLDAVVVRMAGSGVRAVDVGALAAIEVTGKAVLLHTGGD